MKTIKNILFFLFILFALNGKTQNYVDLGDLTGYNTPSYLMELDEKATELKEAFNIDHQNNFKVFEFSFYVYNELMTDGRVPAIWADAIADAAANSIYYVIYGRESNHDGVFNQVRVAYNLPTTNGFLCANDNYLQVIENSLTDPMNDIFENGPTSGIYQALMTSMENLTDLVHRLENCCENGVFNTGCGCIANIDEIRSFFKAKDFLRVEGDLITVQPTNKYIELDSDYEVVVVSNQGESYSFTDDTEGVLNQVDGEARLLYFDGDNCSLFSDYVELNSNSFFKEEIVVFSFSGKYEVFYKIISDEDSYRGDNESADREILVCPPCVWVVAHIIKKLASASLGVVIHLGVETAIEKWVVGHDTWGEAWEAKNFTSGEELWKIAAAFGSGFMAEKKYLSAGIDAFGEVAAYLAGGNFTVESFGIMIGTTLISGVLNIYGGQMLESIKGAVLKNLYGDAAGDIGAKAFKELYPIFIKNPLSLPKFCKYINGWKKFVDDGLPPAFRRNLTNLDQRTIIDDWAGDIATATNKQKGNFGEIGADLDLNAKNYESLQPRIDGIDSPGHNGIDGIYKKNGEYIIVEGKYTGSASLNPANLTTGLDRQMSDAWIQADNRLLDALGGNQSLVDDILETNYTRVLAKTAPDGTVTYKYVSDIGYLTQGDGPLGDWTP